MNQDLLASATPAAKRENVADKRIANSTGLLRGNLTTPAGERTAPPWHDAQRKGTDDGRITGTMTTFEYVMVMVSVVLALALAQLLRALTEVVTNPRRYWVHALWMLSLVLLIVQIWWAYWDFNATETWTFALYLYLLAYPIGVFIAASLLVPATRAADMDWRAHYYRVHRWAFTALLACSLIALTGQVFYLGVPALHPYRVFQVPMIASLLGAVLATGHGAHRLFAVAFFGLLLVSQLVIRMNLGALVPG
jgi:hypothetical protein